MPSPFPGMNPRATTDVWTITRRHHQPSLKSMPQGWTGGFGHKRSVSSERMSTV